MGSRVVDSSCFSSIGYFAFGTARLTILNESLKRKEDSVFNIFKLSLNMYAGVAGTVCQILKEEGSVGFTRNMGPRVVHSACFSAIGYFAFETARLTILNEYLKRKEDSEAATDADS